MEKKALANLEKAVNFIYPLSICAVFAGAEYSGLGDYIRQYQLNKFVDGSLNSFSDYFHVYVMSFAIQSTASLAPGSLLGVFLAEPVKYFIKRNKR